MRFGYFDFARHSRCLGNFYPVLVVDGYTHFVPAGNFSGILRNRAPVLQNMVQSYVDKGYFGGNYKFYGADET